MTRKNWRSLGFLAIAILLGVLVSAITMSVAPHLYQPSNTSSDANSMLNKPALTCSAKTHRSPYARCEADNMRTVANENHSLRAPNSL
jgi:hypothetical protein